MSFYESPSVSYGKSFGSGSLEIRLPKLRTDLVVRQQVREHEVYYIIKDPVLKTYYQFNPDEWDLFQLFDGTRTDEEIIEQYNAKHPFGVIDEETIDSYKNSLMQIDLFEIPPAEKNLMLMERIRSQRKAKAEGDESIFYMSFSAWDPDESLNKIIRHIRWLWSREFFIFSLICIILGLMITFSRWDGFKEGVIENYSFHKKSFWQVFVFIFLMFTTGGIHELAHGLTLKNFGGEVRQMGFILFYISPAFFCDVSDSYLLQEKKARRWVILSGGYSELFVCSIAGFVWYFAIPGTLLYDFSFQIMLFTGVSSFLFNMNPLVKLDGYFLLMDFVGIPDLRENSFEYAGQWIKKNILRQKVEDMPDLTRRKRRIYLTYAFFSAIWTTTLYVLIVVWFRNIFVGLFKQWGYLPLSIIVFLLFRKELQILYGNLKFVYLDKKEILMKKKKYVIAGAAVALVLLLTIPTHIKVSSSFVVQPYETSEIRNEGDGFIRKVLVMEGTKVKTGQVIATLENPDLSQDVSRVQAKLELEQRQLALLQATYDPAEYQMKLKTREQLEQQRAVLNERVTKLVLRSPMNGRIVTPGVDEKEGSYIRKGELFCKVADVDKVKLELPVQEHELQDVHPGYRVRVKLDAFPTKSFEGVVKEIAPAGADYVESVQGTYARFRVLVVMQNPADQWVSGMRGDAKILGNKLPVLFRIGREITRSVRSRVWW
ncbi:efflux RND transporter periplasmic adaptor subunit [bacterium]|nr:efflux RND transporter periplasmic adaptor subunit [bacterium]